MGFGYLLLGYLTAFVLRLIPDSLGLEGLAALIGYGLILYGLSELKRYQRSFLWAMWLCIPMLILSAWSLFGSLNKLLVWQLPFFTVALQNSLSWVRYLLTVMLQLSVLQGIRILAAEVGLSNTSVKAVRNAVFVLFYALLYPFANLSWRFTVYFVWPTAFVNVLTVVLNLLLFLSCAKDICPAGEEDLPQKPSRFGFLDRIANAYDSLHQKNIDNAKRDAQELLNRRQEAKKRKEEKKKTKRK